jgi:uncharacterized protein (DUF362 family)
MPFSRREFLKSSLVLSGGVLLPRWAHALDGSEVDRLPDVVHATGGSARDMIRAAIADLGGIGNYVKPGYKVLINPNVGFPNPAEMATTTDPLAIGAVAELCVEAGARSVVISDYPVRDPDLCFERSGIADLARMSGVDVTPLSARSPYTNTGIPGAAEVAEVDLATIVHESDAVIAMPVAKCHSSAGVSFSMKGNMGLIQARGPFHSRYDLHQAVVDLAKLIQPTLVITDAQRALVTRGPGGPGRVETPGAILAGLNAASVDAYAVGLAQWYNRAFRPDQVRHIRLAGEQGLGIIDTDQMLINRVTV